MIELKKGDKLIYDDTLSVYEDGIYEDTDLVLVIKDGEDVPQYQFQAYFIKNNENI